MKKLLAERKIENIEVSSAGLSAFYGDEAAAYAVEAAKKLGADISGHRSGRVDSALLSDSIFICMTSRHAAALAPYVEGEKLIVLGQGIPDPYGGSQEIYDTCAENINARLEPLLAEIVKRNVLLEDMQTQHIEGIARLEGECFSQPWSENALAEELSNENAHFIVATLAGQVIGYVGVIEVCGEAYITNVAVNGSYRRLGVADMLINKAVDCARERKCQFITLEVRQSNLAAIALYLKHGFTSAGVRKGFYEKPKEDAILMTKMFE